MESKASAKKHLINNGVILGIISVLLGATMYALDLSLQPPWYFGVIGFAINIVIVVMAIKAFKADNNGFLKLAEALKIGLGVALIASIIGVVWTLIQTQVLMPDYAEQMVEVQRAAMIEAQPNMTESQMEQALEFGSKFASPLFTIPMQIIAGLFFGFIISLIAGLVMKHENPHADA